MVAPMAAKRSGPPDESWSSQSGAALLTVLLLVAILSVIAAVALERLTLASRMTRNIVSADQGRAFLLTAEQIAALKIGDLVAQSADRTTLAGDWLGTPQIVPVPGGSVTLRVTDADNCFNLNSLVTDKASMGTEDLLIDNPQGIAQFAGLMTLLGVDRASAEQIAVSAADWIDSDSVPGPGGAEDDYYSRFTPPYLAANSLMADPSELRMINAVTPDIYARLRPWICALPTTALSPLNINTLLPGQALLLAMLAPNKLGIERARQVLAQRPGDGYGSLEAFWNQRALASLALSDDVRQQVKQKSRWFEVALSADLGGDVVDETVLYDAKQRPARAVRRQWGTGGD